MQKVMKERKQRPVFIIDISVPRNIDPEINDLDNVYLYNVDDLQGVVDANMFERQKEAEKAEKIIEEEIGDLSEVAVFSGFCPDDCSPEGKGGGDQERRNWTSSFPGSRAWRKGERRR